MVDIKVASVTIGGRSYNKDKSGYPAQPTVFSGVEITWGAGSCVENPEPSRVAMSLWVPKVSPEFIPSLGEVVKVIGGPINASSVAVSASLFAGKVESVKMKDNHKVDGGYFINIIGSDALAEAGRLRLSDDPWPREGVLVRQQRIRDVAAASGVTFRGSDTPALGFSETVGTGVIPRDVDSFPALELFQRTSMAAGRTVVSVDNVVQPSTTMKLPTYIGNTTSSPSAYYRYVGTVGDSKSQFLVNGVVTRTNHAKNPTGRNNSTGYAALPGNGTASIIRYGISSGRYGNAFVAAKWSVESAPGLPVGISYIDSGVTGASGTKVSVGVWGKFVTAPGYIPMINYGGSNIRLRVELLVGSTVVGSATGALEYLEPNIWRYLKLENVNATAAYTSVKIYMEDPSGYMSTIGYYGIDGIIIEQASTVGGYFDGESIHKSIQAVALPSSSVPALTTSMIQDDAFEIDTSKVVNEIKVEMKLWTYETNEIADADQLFTDEEGSRKTTPQTRSITTDWAIQDTFMDVDIPKSVMVTKGRLMLAAQARPQWRLSQTMRLVPSQIPATVDLTPLLAEDTRFGALINISDAPDLLPKYQRACAGRILLGETTELEFDLEPVDYSAPVPLTKNTMNGDYLASYYSIGSFKNITSNDLRSIGAR